MLAGNAFPKTLQIENQKGNTKPCAQLNPAPACIPTDPATLCLLKCISELIIVYLALLFI